MTVRLRAYVSAILVGVLVLTGHSMAIARGMPGVAGYAEYCIGESPVMVPVDAEGNPTGAPHLCPDFSASLLAGIFAETAPTGFDWAQGGMLRVARGTLTEVIRFVPTSARAPPAVVSNFHI